MLNRAARCRWKLCHLVSLADTLHIFLNLRCLSIISHSFEHDLRQLRFEEEARKSSLPLRYHLSHSGLELKDLPIHRESVCVCRGEVIQNDRATAEEGATYGWPWHF